MYRNVTKMVQRVPECHSPSFLGGALIQGDCGPFKKRKRYQGYVCTEEGPWVDRERRSLSANQPETHSAGTLILNFQPLAVKK